MTVARTPLAAWLAALVTMAAVSIAVPLTAHANEYGRVLSSTPIVTQVAVPRQVCTQQPVAVRPQTSGAGAVMGAIAGGAMGNAIGDGSGRAAATLIGIVGGAMLGDRIESSGPSEVRHVQQCTTQTFYENRTTGYQVVYEYAGKQYSVQMPHDPGSHVRLQITPVGQWNSDGSGGVVSHVVPGAPAPVFISPPQVITSTTYVVPAPVVVHRPAQVVTIVPWVGVAPRPHAYPHSAHPVHPGQGHDRRADRHGHRHPDWHARAWPHGHWR
ncbi:MAG: glycine zipper 2TM domain-containing protein [Burkholderiaceae bacterium]